MLKTFNIGKYQVEFGYSKHSLAPWYRVETRKDENSWALFIGGTHFRITDMELEIYEVCGECDSGEELKHMSWANGGLRYCEQCESVEGRTRYVGQRELERLI